MAKLEFSVAIITFFSVTWSFRNHSDMLILCLRNISYQLLSMLKTALLL